MLATPACVETNTPFLLPQLCGHDRYSAQRGLLENFIQTRYAESYSARITHFLPILMASWAENQLQGVLGLRPGACGQFFVERYLDDRIEQIVSRNHPVAVPRDRIIETGNLAGSRGSSQFLFVALTEILYQAGFHWVTFTATPQVNALLQRLGFAPQAICIAEPARLGAQREDWGSYYDNQPCVVIGDVTQARWTLKSNELAQKLLADHEQQITAVALQLRRASEAGRHE